MKELAVVKLTKSLFGKMGEKVSAKKKKWAEEAAISVEENKRREVEFKEDFQKVKEKLKPDAIKEEIEKSVEAAKELKAKVEEGVRSDSANEVMKAVSPKVEKKSLSHKEEPKAIKQEAVVPELKEEKPVVKSEEKSQKPSAEKTTTNKKESNTSGTVKKKPASKKEAKIALYSEDITKHYGEVDADFLAIIVKNLGPSIYRKDAELVSCSDSKELDTVRNNFLIKKLQMKESNEVLNSAIKEVCEELKSSRNKYRATFYYALAKKFKQESKLS